MAAVRRATSRGRRSPAALTATVARARAGAPGSPGRRVTMPAVGGKVGDALIAASTGGNTPVARVRDGGPLRRLRAVAAP